MAPLQHSWSSVCYNSDILTDDATSEYHSDNSDSELKALMGCMCNAAMMMLKFELIA